MNNSLPSPLSRLDRLLLSCGLRIVPQGERADWLRCWQAELWHRRHPRSAQAPSAAELYPGLICDCVWLRTHRWHRSLSGTALVCVLFLGSILLSASLALWTLLNSWPALCSFAWTHLGLFLFEAALVTFVSFATCSRTVEYPGLLERSTHFRSQVFLSVKSMLVLLIAFVTSQDMTLPLHANHPFSAEMLQPQMFVLLALLALRWSFADQNTRCKHCLRSLSAPERVGRPSWNFLDSNGVELLCRDGHGLLSVPEMETSWRRSSRWIAA